MYFANLIITVIYIYIQTVLKTEQTTNEKKNSFDFDYLEVIIYYTTGEEEVEAAAVVLIKIKKYYYIFNKKVNFFDRVVIYSSFTMNEVR